MYTEQEYISIHTYILCKVKLIPFYIDIHIFDILFNSTKILIPFESTTPITPRPLYGVSSQAICWALLKCQQ